MTNATDPTGKADTLMPLDESELDIVAGGTGASWTAEDQGF